MAGELCHEGNVSKTPFTSYRGCRHSEILSVALDPISSGSGEVFASAVGSIGLEMHKFGGVLAMHGRNAMILFQASKAITKLSLRIEEAKKHEKDYFQGYLFSTW
ncbi:predicted protein [Histoplasma capsulatum var. duboisii H88]|uniref:Predicted protein n=2 Tax=Ajellomyces capsulatus TaxID=5037 RepID=F0UQF0_AJEC8|nr:predicted protein [Histoplasma capsulatum H143]EGC47940.1 predicted protein [Histoplasma capsulatum var. duboisii H88]